MESFDKWLDARIKEKGWKPADLARKSGLDSAVISNLLNNRRQAGPDTCTAIAHALGLPPEQVFRNAGLLPPARETDPWVEEMKYKMAQLDPARRQIAENLLDALLKEETPAPVRKPRAVGGKA